MPGRNVDTRPVARERGRSGRVVAPAMAALTLVAIGIVIGSRAAPEPMPSALSDTNATVDANPPPGQAKETRARMIPTREGAVAAAARSITMLDGDVLLDSRRLRRVVARMASGASRSQLIESFAIASAQTRAMLGVDTVPRPVVVLRSIPVGYRVEQFSDDEVTVAVWYVGIVGSGATIEPQQSWRTQMVRLVWENNEWKVRSFEASPGPTPPLSATEATTQPGDIFTAIATFSEIENAG